MWHFFVPSAPRLQDAITSAVGGNEYAVGQYSVQWARANDYTDHRVVMLLHTSLAALALTMAWPQFSHRLRTRRPAVHRWCGRVYFTLMTASMGTAIGFLLLRAPADYPGFTAFDLQLWVLALGTLFTGGVALRAIRRGDVLTHRAWMGYHIAMMMTAPLLRVLWTFLAPLLPEYRLLTNLGAGSIMLGVIAPAGGAVAFMRTHRDRGAGAEKLCGPTVYLALVIVAIVGSILFAMRYQPLLEMVPADLLGIHLVPAWGYLSICAIGVYRARRAGFPVQEQLWRWMMIGAALTPLTAMLLGLVRDAQYGNLDGFVAGAMIGPPIPITLSFALVVRSAANAIPIADRIFSAPITSLLPDRRAGNRRQAPSAGHDRGASTDNRLSPRMDHSMYPGHQAEVTEVLDATEARGS